MSAKNPNKRDPDFVLRDLVPTEETVSNENMSSLDPSESEINHLSGNVSEQGSSGIGVLGQPVTERAGSSTDPTTESTGQYEQDDAEDDIEDYATDTALDSAVEALFGDI